MVLNFEGEKTRNNCFGVDKINLEKPRSRRSTTIANSKICASVLLIVTYFAIENRGLKNGTPTLERHISRERFSREIFFGDISLSREKFSRGIQISQSLSRQNTHHTNHWSTEQATFYNFDFVIFNIISRKFFNLKLISIIKQSFARIKHQSRSRVSTIW